MQAARKQLEYTPDPNKFDLVTHRWDAQGKLVHFAPYRKFIQSGVEYYERPVNSGNLWYENNQPAGRVICEFNEKGHICSKAFDLSAQHVDYTPPLTGDQKLAAQLSTTMDENAALKAELAAIKKDREPVVVQAEPAAPKNHAPQASAKPAQPASPPTLSKPE